jgi:DNA-binding XRE family transcriptional regulator
VTTIEPFKAARKLLRWSQMRLAHEANVAQTTVVNCESGKRHTSAHSMLSIRNALEAAGVEFVDDPPSVRLKGSSLAPVVETNAPERE